MRPWLGGHPAHRGTIYACTSNANLEFGVALRFDYQYGPNFEALMSTFILLFRVRCEISRYLLES